MNIIESLNVSLIFIAICGASLFAYTATIGPLRGRLGILRGDGGDATLFKRVRLHANFVENAPLIAMVFLAAEALGAPDAWMWAAVTSFFVGRIYHALRYDEMDRAVGMFFTQAPAVALSVFVIVKLV